MTTRPARRNSGVPPKCEADKKHPRRSDTDSRDCPTQSISHRATRPQSSQNCCGPVGCSARDHRGASTTATELSQPAVAIFSPSGDHAAASIFFECAGLWNRRFPLAASHPQSVPVSSPSAVPSGDHAINLVELRGPWNSCESFQVPASVSPNGSFVIAYRETISFRRPRHHPERTRFRT